MRVCWLSYESEVDFAHYDAKKQFQELDPFLFNLQEKKKIQKLLVISNV